MSYPYSEGQTYYTIEGNAVVESCWDDISEEIHDDNVRTGTKIRYYKTKKEALLIAAAPDLLAALEEIRAEVVEWVQDDDFNISSSDAMDSIGVIAGVAIAKAKGDDIGKTL